MLEEARKELDLQKKSAVQAGIQSRISLLREYYSSGSLAANDLFEKDTLMHCVLLSDNTLSDESNAHHILQETVTFATQPLGNCLFRSRGSIHTYLLNRTLLPKEEKHFAEQLLSELESKGLKCTLLFDNTLFVPSPVSFRELYSGHLYTLLTKTFYGSQGYQCYTTLTEPTSDYDSALENDFLSSMKESLAELRRADLGGILRDFVENLRRLKPSLEDIQRINYRIYYLLVEVMASVNESEPENPLLQPLEWRDNPCFYTFDAWVQHQQTLIDSAYTFLERCRKMKRLGISGEIAEYVFRHFQEPLSIRQLSDLFYVNPAYLGRAFRKATGVPFNQYLHNLRMSEAKRLLLQTDKHVYEISSMLGYAECKYFTAKFTADIGISPIEYRKRGKEV